MSYGRLADWLADEMQVDFEIFKILYRPNYLYFTSFNIVMIVLSVHFNWFFSTKAYFKLCIEVQNILVTIFSSIPTIEYYRT